MNANITKRNELLAQKVIKGLQSRNMTGYYAADKEAALKQALALIPEGSTVTMGGGMSVHEIGLVKALTEGNYNFIDRDAVEDKRAAMLAAYDADFYLMSANAMTEDGIMVNIDGNSNRVSALAQGPRKVIVIAGMNKICDDVDGAMKRARNVRAEHALCQDRFLHELQISRYDLLSVSDHALFQASRQDSCDPCQRQSGILSSINK